MQSTRVPSVPQPGVERLNAKRLNEEQQKTLVTPRMRYGFLARILFLIMDVMYGRKKSISKSKVLELIARLPYQAWENIAYIAITHMAVQPDFARRIFDRVMESRRQQDNEQWHLLILEELKRKKGIRENFIWHWLIPQIIAFTYYNISWILYVIKPGWSYTLNAEFEDHAEHEYMEFAKEHPEFDTEPYLSEFADDYGHFESLGDVFRQIGYDERVHKMESLERVPAARFQ